MERGSATLRSWRTIASRALRSSDQPSRDRCRRGPALVGRLGLNARLPGGKRWPVGALVEGSEDSTLGWLAAGSGSVQDAAMDDAGVAAGSAGQARAWAAL